MRPESSILLILLSALSGVTFLTAAFYYILFIRRRTQPIYRAYSVLCFFATVYIFCNLLLYLTSNVSAYLSIVRVQMYATAGFHLALLWFCSIYTGIRMRGVIIFCAACFASFIVARHVSPLVMYDSIRGITTVTMPWGEKLSLLDARYNSLVYAYEALILLVYFSVLTQAARLFRLGNRRNAYLLGLGILFILITVTHDIIIANLKINWIYLGEAGIVAMIILMSYTLTEMVIHVDTLAKQVLDNEKKLSAIFNSTYQFIWLLDTRGRLIDTNEAALEFAGVAKESVRNRPFRDTPWWAGLEDEKAKLRESFGRAAAGEFIRYTARHTSRDGRILFFDFSQKPVFGERGRVEYVIAEGRDISEIKEAEDRIIRQNEEFTAVNEELTAAIEELEATNEAFDTQNRELMVTQEVLRNREREIRHIVENIPGVVYQFYAGDDGTMGLHFVSEQAANLLGLTNLDEMFFERFTEGVVDEDRAAFLSSIGEAVRSFSNWMFEGRYRKPGGEVIWFRGSSIPVRQAGEIVFNGVILDITSIKAAEDALRMSEEKFNKAFHSNPTAMAIIEFSSGRYIEINDSALKQMGYTRDEIIGRTMSEIDLYPDSEEPSAMASLLLRNGSIREYECRFRFKSGEARSGIVDADMITVSGVRCAIASMIDITEQKRAREVLQQSEEKFSKAFEENPSPMNYIDMGTGRILDVNRAYIDALGFSREEIIGRTDKELGIYANRDERIRVYRKVFETGRLNNELIQFIAKDRSIKWGLLSVTVIHIRGKPCALAMVVDITAQKYAEDEIRRIERELESILRTTPDIIYRLDSRGTITYINDAVKRYGYTSADMLGKNIIDFVHPDDVEKATYRLNERRTGQRSTRYLELRLFSSNKQVVHFEYSSMAAHGDRVFLIQSEGLYDADSPDAKSFLGTQGIARDITERKQVEAEREAALEALRQREEQLHFITHNMIDMVAFANSEGRYLYTSPSYYTILGYTDDEMKAMVGFDLIHPEDRERVVRQYMDSIGAGQHEIRYETRLRHRDGHYVPLEVFAKLIYDENGRLSSGILTSRDQTERLRAEAALRESEELYRVVATTTGQIVYDYDISSGKITWSGAIQDVSGYTSGEFAEFDIHIWRDHIHPDDRTAAISMLEESLSSARPYEMEYRFRGKNGDFIPIVDHGAFITDRDGRVIRMLGTMIDITERKKAQREKEEIQSQLLHAQKMEAVGTLAGGLAHDFNNVLGGIVGSLSILELILESEKLAQRETISGYLATAVDSSRRAAEMIRQLLSLSRKQDLVLAPMDLNHSLKNVEQICRNSFPKSVILEFRPAPRPMRIMGDPTRIEQALLNLCVNASHAMTIMRGPGEREGGTLAVEVDGLSDSALIQRAAPGTDLQPPLAVVRISDTGIGMDGETINRIFEPFFTTKKREDGTGLGLAMTYSILQQHGGYISVTTRKGAGSTFTVFLPELRERDHVHSDKPVSEKIVMGSGLILVIDDESAIVRIADGILRRCGYSVATEESAEKGISTYRERHEEIAAVLLDMSMPHMSGLEVSERLAAINPRVKILLTSGFSEDERVQKALRGGVSGFLQKPYTAQELSEKIKMIIAG